MALLCAKQDVVAFAIDIYTSGVQTIPSYVYARRKVPKCLGINDWQSKYPLVAMASNLMMSLVIEVEGNITCMRKFHLAMHLCSYLVILHNIILYNIIYILK